MTDKQEAEWVCGGAFGKGSGQNTNRFPVPGGWLYVTDAFIPDYTNPAERVCVGVSTVFVPEPLPAPQPAAIGPLDPSDADRYRADLDAIRAAHHPHYPVLSPDMYGRPMVRRWPYDANVWTYDPFPGMRVACVRENGVAAFRNDGDVTEFVGRTEPGAYRTCQALGLIQMGAEPLGKLTVDFEPIPEPQDHDLGGRGPSRMDYRLDYEATMKAITTPLDRDRLTLPAQRNLMQSMTTAIVDSITTLRLDLTRALNDLRREIQQNGRGNSA